MFCFYYFPSNKDIENNFLFNLNTVKLKKDDTFGNRLSNIVYFFRKKGLSFPIKPLPERMKKSLQRGQLEP